MRTDTIFQVVLLFSIIGLILYLPLKPHWNKIFSLWDAVFFYVGLAAPILYIYLMPNISQSEGIGGIAMAIIFGGGFALYGLYRLILCWNRCSNLLQVVFTPICMLLMFGAFIISLLSIAFVLVGISQRQWFYWDDNDWHELV